MLHAIGLFAGLYGLWLALSGHYTPFLLAVGGVCAALVVAVSLRMDRVDRHRYPPYWSHRLPLYWAWLAVEVVIWSVRIARCVLAPRLDIDPVVERVPSNQLTDLGRVTYANSITLTPGTLSIDVSGGEIEVHALTRAAMADLKSGEMNRRVTRLEGGA